jgi:hypothetical protein
MNLNDFYSENNEVFTFAMITKEVNIKGQSVEDSRH